jgi:hypothetical protein
MKKNIVLFVLFVLPIVAYLFFASGVNNFAKLPVVTSSVADFGPLPDQDGRQISLNGKITIIGFGGYDLLRSRGNLFNLNQKIYQRYHEFKDLQFVILCPTGTQADAKEVLSRLSAFTDVSHWHFVFADPALIKQFHQGLQISHLLNENLSTSNVYIIDKERNLRGRKGDQKFEAGYNTFHPSEISNEMLDDFKVILYEYRAALKKNNNASKRL